MLAYWSTVISLHIWSFILFTSISFSHQLGPTASLFRVHHILTYGMHGSSKERYTLSLARLWRVDLSLLRGGPTDDWHKGNNLVPDRDNWVCAQGRTTFNCYSCCLVFSSHDDARVAFIIATIWTIFQNRPLTEVLYCIRSWALPGMIDKRIISLIPRGSKEGLIPS
jgi:hypothetical protein